MNARIPLLLLAVMGLNALAQSYSVDWHKVAGGGGTSTNGSYQVSGTFGQHDASGAMSGGPVTGTNYYSVTGGFWSLISVVQTAGVPNLILVPDGTNGVKILWPAPATNSYTLQQSSNLADPGGWVPGSYAITATNGTNSVTITSPAGNLFFRLKR